MRSDRPAVAASTLSLHLLSVASGFSALVFEVLWMRRFSAVFGATATAAAATLSAFFLGLAVGSAVLGKWTVRWSRPLRAFGVLQIGVAAAALLVEPALRLFERHYSVVHAALHGHAVLLVAAKVALAMTVVFLPTFLMGGSLPVLAQAAAAGRGRLGFLVGGLYSANALGGTLGAAAVPFVLLPAFGVDRAYWVAVGTSFLCGVMACVLATRRAVKNAVPPPSVPRGPASTPSLRGFRLLGVSAFLSGFLLMALEVLWARMFALVHENSVYSFSAVVATFLAGLAGGAALAKEFLRRSTSAKTALALAWTVGGLLVLLSPRLFGLLAAGPGEAGAASGFRVFVIAVPLMLPALLTAGAIFPLLIELAGAETGAQAGPTVGNLLAVNTVGSILGPLAGSVALSSALGLWWSILLVGAVMVVLGEASFRMLSSRRWPVLCRTAVFAALAVGTLLLYPGARHFVRFDPAKGERLLHLEEGTYGAVAVLEDSDHRWLTLDNDYLLGGTASAREERHQTHLPLLLHPLPRRVAFLGLGTGITAGAALVHPVDSVVALEIVPQVIRAAREYFAEENLGVMSDPRVEVVAEDARNFLKGSGRKFDVIIGDLVVPWRPGESALLSLEHFRTTRESLLPGGIFCQWIPLFQLSDEGFRIVTATFLEVFPNGTIWRGDFLADQPAVALVGQRDSGALDVSAIDRRVRELSDVLAKSNPYLADPAGLWLYLLGPLDANAPALAAVRRNRDSQPWLELLTPTASDLRTPLRAARFETALFEQASARSLRGSPLERLDSEHLRWRDAGAALWRASILAAEGREQESQTGMLEAFSALPARLQSAVLGDPPQGGGIPTYHAR